MGSLRFSLALGVALGHASIFFGPFVPGDTAVQGFYAISGFYMALVLNEKYERGASGCALFWSNRFLRLWPVYAAVLALTLMLAIVAPLPFVAKWRASAPIDPAALAFLLGSQLLMIGQDLYSFLGLHGGALTFAGDFHLDSHPLYGLMPVPQAWTLGIELAFYAVAPFIVRRSSGVFVAWILASIALRLGLQLALGLEGDPWSYRFFPSELALFLTGALGYRSFRGDAIATRWLTAIAFTLGAALLINRWHGATRVISVIALVAILIAIPRLARSGSGAIDRFLGELSYPIYIGHVLVIWTVDDTAHLATPMRDMVIVALTLTFSALLYVFIDRPIDRWRQSRSRRPALGSLVKESAICSSR